MTTRHQSKVKAEETSGKGIKGEESRDDSSIIKISQYLARRLGYPEIAEFIREHMEMEGERNAEVMGKLVDYTGGTAAFTERYVREARKKDLEMIDRLLKHIETKEHLNDLKEVSATGNDSKTTEDRIKEYIEREGKRHLEMMESILSYVETPDVIEKFVEEATDKLHTGMGSTDYIKTIEFVRRIIEESDKRPSMISRILRKGS